MGSETVLLKINLKLALSFSVTFNRDTTDRAHINFLDCFAQLSLGILSQSTERVRGLDVKSP